MIVGCYDLHLYCRHELLRYYGGRSVPKGFHDWDSGASQFIGETFAEAKAQSRKVGWTWQRDGEVTCPLCNRKGTPNDR